MHSSTVLENDADSQADVNYRSEDGKAYMGLEAEKEEHHTPPLRSSALEEASVSPVSTEQVIRREVVEPVSTITEPTVPVAEPTNTSRFEAASAEAELDMLLDSFSSANLSSFIPVNSVIGSSSHKTSNFGSLASLSGQRSSRDPDASAHEATTSIDDSIDDLLAETSLSLNELKQTSPQQKQTSPENFSLASSSANANASHNDSIFDLLAETSASFNACNHTADQQSRGAVSSSKDFPLETISTHSQALEDLDSWLDTL